VCGVYLVLGKEIWCLEDAEMVGQSEDGGSGWDFGSGFTCKRTDGTSTQDV
jgi:hypothetical protein